MPNSPPSSATLKIRRGEIWLADLNPPFGAEPGKRRPVLVVQSQVLLDSEYSTTLIVPLTTQLIDDAAPLRLRVGPAGRLHRRSDLLIAQMRSIDNRRLMEGPLARLGALLLARVDDAIREVLGLEL
jgi:mRNA interferase MazF